MGLRKIFRKHEQRAAVAQSLQVFSNSDSANPRHGSADVNSDHADDGVSVDKHQRMIAGFGVVRMVFVIDFGLAAILEKHLAANGVERLPLFLVNRRS